MKPHSLGIVLRAALAAVNADRVRVDATAIPAMRWYEATRHSYASRYVQAGGSLMKLAAILGHSATEVTLRYAHLQPGNFTEAERALVDVQLSDAKVLPLASLARYSPSVRSDTVPCEALTQARRQVFAKRSIVELVSPPSWVHRDVVPMGEIFRQFAKRPRSAAVKAMRT